MLAMMSTADAHMRFGSSGNHENSSQPQQAPIIINNPGQPTQVEQPQEIQPAQEIRYDPNVTHAVNNQPPVQADESHWGWILIIILIFVIFGFVFYRSCTKNLI